MPWCALHPNEQADFAMTVWLPAPWNPDHPVKHHLHICQVCAQKNGSPPDAKAIVDIYEVTTPTLEKEKPPC